MTFAVGVVVAALVAVGIVQLTSHRSARRDGADSAVSGMLGELIDVFQPSRSNVTREREWQRTAIVQRPSEAPPFDVDLDAGVVRIRPDDPTDPVA
ncbi:hypothetical protein DDP54_07330 [Cellulomonas sp. WB94]|uniref:DUF6191 domain-containing protein n=1 Tax=Cellulomonas sp. WB94 TaxID=2173174 RepID=UPI000D587E7D|nr:DUF6191 domain-containing protein [Cellulomonas sp. WB94]PVU82846.1 hypothetical protein DDP54_07330 [Cellulomonas sp. WB94]